MNHYVLYMCAMLINEHLTAHNGMPSFGRVCGPELWRAVYSCHDVVPYVGVESTKQ